MLLSASASGDVLEFTDKDAWINAVGDFTTVDFTGFPEGTFITDQYADLGILFTDGNDSIHFRPSFVNDGVGLDGNGNITVVFDTPQAWIGVDFPGDLQIDLFSEGRLIHTSVFIAGGIGNFGGLVSDQRFDMAVLMDFPLDFEAEIDDLHFGPPVCTADIDEDGKVGITDFLALLAAWGPNPGHPADFDGDGVVGIVDFLQLLAAWGACP